MVNNSNFLWISVPSVKITHLFLVGKHKILLFWDENTSDILHLYSVSFQWRNTLICSVTSVKWNRTHRLAHTHKQAAPACLRHYQEEEKRSIWTHSYLYNKTRNKVPWDGKQIQNVSARLYNLWEKLKLSKLIILQIL